MEYLILIGVVFAALMFNKIRSFFISAKDTKLTNEDKKLHEKETELKKDIEQLHKKLNKTYSADMTPEEIEEFWRGKK